MKKLTILILLCGISLFGQTPYNENSTITNIGNSYRLDCHAGHINYKDSEGIFRKINTKLISMADGWVQDSASYKSKFPLVANNWFEFESQYRNKLSLNLRPISNKVSGEKIAGDEEYILYKDAFGKGIDMQAHALRHGIKRLIVINDKLDDSVSFEFEVNIALNLISSLKDDSGTSYKNQLTSGAVDFTGKTAIINESVYFHKASVWDSKGMHEDVNLQLVKAKAKILLRKTISKEFLASAAYPVYTDDVQSYYAGSGDGFIYGNNATWSTARSTASSADYTSNLMRARIWWSTTYRIYRCFIPIATDLPDGATVTSASLYVYINDNDWYDNDGYDYIRVVETTQASTTQLTTSDYNSIGTTALSADKDCSSDFSGGYNEFALNSTGIAAIVDGTTKIGLREGHDVQNHTHLASSGSTGIIIYSSEDTDGDKDPYLSITYTLPAAGGQIVFFVE